MRDLCRLVLTCRLTRDPELRHTAGGTPVCKMRVAYSSRRRDEAGNWGDKSNYLDVAVFGNQAEACAQYLSKGRPCLIEGRLDWREWTGQDDGIKRQAYECVADQVIFLGSKDGDGGGGDESAPSESFVPAGSTDDDIPFAFLDRWGVEPVASVRHGCPTRTTAKLHLW